MDTAQRHHKSDSLVAIVLPVRDEAAALPWVLGRVPPGYEPIVVDNGSRDGSAAIAARLGAQVVTEPRPGYGAACYAGLLAARTEVVCFMDCDGALDPRELDTVVEPVLAGERELVLGARQPSTPNAWPWHARVANRLLAAEMRRRGIELHDIGPMRAARRTALLALELRDRRFGWPLEMIVRAAEAGWRISEVDVTWHPRVGGRSKVTGSLRGTLLTVLDMTTVLL